MLFVSLTHVACGLLGFNSMGRMFGAGMFRADDGLIMKYGMPVGLLGFRDVTRNHQLHTYRYYCVPHQLAPLISG